MAGYSGEDQSAEINVAVWVLIGVSTLFLGARFWCRARFARLWWDDLVLAASWVSSFIFIYPYCQHAPFANTFH
jgi:hypothetical protein